MPYSRAYTSFLQPQSGRIMTATNGKVSTFLPGTGTRCPRAWVVTGKKRCSNWWANVSMPSRAYTSFLQSIYKAIYNILWWCFNALSGWYLISTFERTFNKFFHKDGVNALSGWYLISTGFIVISTRCESISVSMPSRVDISFLHVGQYLKDDGRPRVNALSGWYLISTVPLQKPRFYAVSRACFCRYLSEYSDNSRFSCMLTFWTYLMRCTYPWHWIKYSTKYNRCHPIFSLSW